MYAVIGLVIGLLVNFTIIRPIQRKYWRNKCIEEHSAPNEEAKEE